MGVAGWWNGGGAAVLELHAKVLEGNCGVFSNIPLTHVGVNCGVAAQWPRIPAAGPAAATPPVAHASSSRTRISAAAGGGRRPPGSVVPAARRRQPARPRAAVDHSSRIEHPSLRSAMLAWHGSASVPFFYAGLRPIAVVCRTAGPRSALARRVGQR
jgi:hypothetical protein